MAIMAGTARRVRASYHAATDDEYVERLFTSCLLPTWALFAWRTLVAVYAFTVLFTFLGYNDTHDNAQASQRSFSFFTVLTYWGLAFYFAFASLHTGARVFRGRAFLSSWPAWMRWLHSAYYATITVFPYIVTVVFWSVLAQDAFDTRFNAWSNMSQHALNSLLAFSELLLPRSRPHPWLNLIAIPVVLLLYLGLAYLTHATQGFYVYPFLDPSSGAGVIVGACIAILVAAILVFIIVRYLQMLRNWAFERKWGLPVRASPARTEAGVADDASPEMAETRKSARAREEGVVPQQV